MSAPMRLFLLPISTRRTLIYCERAQQVLAPGTNKPPLTDRIITKAADTWAGWEKAEKGWQKALTTQGNKFLRRIPFEEWGLKTLPPATKKRLEDVGEGRVRFECLFPAGFVGGGGKGGESVDVVRGVLERLGVERQALHRKRLWQSILLMPPTIPFALVPIIPNLPFFYLCFRAYSHYRALYGSKLLHHLTTRNLVTIRASTSLDEMYTAGLLHPTRSASRSAPRPTPSETEQVARIVEAQTRDGKEEVMVLQKWNGKLIAERFGLPEMEIEIERAVEQVEAHIAGEKEKGKGAVKLEEEKDEVMRAIGEKGRVEQVEQGEKSDVKR